MLKKTSTRLQKKYTCRDCRQGWDTAYEKLDHVDHHLLKQGKCPHCKGQIVELMRHTDTLL